MRIEIRRAGLEPRLLGWRAGKTARLLPLRSGSSPEPFLVERLSGYIGGKGLPKRLQRHPARLAGAEAKKCARHFPSSSLSATAHCSCIDRNCSV